MGSNQLVFRNSLFLYLRIGVVMLVNLYASRVLLKSLGVDDFGVYNVVGSVVMMFTSIKGLFISSTQRFMNYEMANADYRGLNSVFSASVMIHIVLCLVFILIVEPIGLYFINYKLQFPQTPLWIVHMLFQMSVISSVIMILTIPYDSLIIANQRMHIYAYLSILETVLKLGAAFVLVLWPTSHRLWIYGGLILAIAITLRLISMLYCRQFKYARLTIDTDKERYLAMIKFAGWNFFGNLTFSLSNEGQNLLLNIFFGPVANAARGIAYQVRSAFYQLTSNLNLAFSPNITQSFANGKYGEMTSMAIIQLKSSVYVISILVLPVLFNAEPILRLWLGIVPEYTVEMVQCLLLLVLMKPFAVVCDSIFKATAELRHYQSMTAMISLAGLFFSWVVLKCGAGLLSVFWVYNVAAFINILLSYWLVKKKCTLEYREFIKASIMCVCCIATLFAVCWTISNVLLYVRLEYDSIVSIAITIMLNIVLVYFVFMSSWERRFIIQKCQKLFSKN